MSRKLREEEKVPAPLVETGEDVSEIDSKLQDFEDLGELKLIGPRWKLPRVQKEGQDFCDVEMPAALRAKLDRQEKINQEMLEQALSCSHLADICLVFDDGKSELSAHKGLLACVSDVFAGMFRSRMTEDQSGEVRVRGVTREAMKAFLEFVYLDVFQADALKEWLVHEGVAELTSACAALHYCHNYSGDFDGLIEACRQRSAWGLPKMDEACLENICMEAAREVLDAHCKNPFHWRSSDALESFAFVSRWAKANGFFGGAKIKDQVKTLLDAIDLDKVPPEVLARVARPSGLVNEGEILDMVLKSQKHPIRNLRVGEHVTEVKSFGCGGDAPGQFRSIYHVAAGGIIGRQVLAAADMEKETIRVFDVETGSHKFDIGTKGADYEISKSYGVAWNGRGELMVSDFDNDCIHFFDLNSKFLKRVGLKGGGAGELYGPSGLTLTPQGDIIICDGCNHRVQVLREDGSYVRAWGTKGAGDGEFDRPTGVAFLADGNIVVCDHNNARIQVFDPEGRFLRKFGVKGNGPGEFQKPYAVATSISGEILVSDWQRHLVQVFSWQGEFKRSIGLEGHSKVELNGSTGVAVDREGRIFVGCNGTKKVVMLSGPQHR